MKKEKTSKDGVCRNCGKEFLVKKEKYFCSNNCKMLFKNRMNLWEKNAGSKRLQKNFEYQGGKVEKEINLYKIRGPIKSYKFDYFFDKITSAFAKQRKFGPIRNPKKILFLRNDHIGDMVYATPAFKIVKENFPDAKTVVLADPHNKSVIEKDKNVDEIWEIDLFWRRLFKLKFGAFVDYLRVLRKIKKEKFDVGIDLRRSKLNMFFFLFVPKIKNRASNYNINGGKVFLTHPLFYEKNVLNHEENVVMMNKAFGLDEKYAVPYVAFDKEDEKKAEGFLQNNKIKKYIVVMPGSTEKEKQWPLDKVDNFIKAFLKKYKVFQVLF